MSDFTDAVAGFDHGDAVARMWQAGRRAATASAASPASSRRSCAQLRRLTGARAAVPKAHSPGAIKMTLPSATQFPAIAYKRGVSDRVYPTPSDVALGHRRRS